MQSECRPPLQLLVRGGGEPRCVDADDIRHFESEALEHARDWIAKQADRGPRRSFGEPRLEGSCPDTVLVVPVMIRGDRERLEWGIWKQRAIGEPYSDPDLMMEIMLGIIEVP